MALTSNDKIIYLANLVSVARADEKLDSREEKAIQEIQKSIGAKKSELNQGYKKAEDEGYKPIPVGRWSEKIKNLEDILYVSMCDGTIDYKEKAVLVDFARSIGITKEQLGLILLDVKNSLQLEGNEINCKNCNNKIKAQSKFCPKCGESTENIPNNQSIAISYDIPSKGISVEFAETTSASFPAAFKNYQEAPSNATCVKSNKTWYLASWPEHQMLDILDLVENLKGLRNKKVYVDGNESKWDDVFSFAWCATTRNAAYRPVEYCFGLDDKRLNLCGCIQAEMEFASRSKWLDYGAYKKIGLFGGSVFYVFDKKRIRHELETNLFRVRFCPHLRFKLIESILDVLPDEVSPSTNGPWRYKIDYEEKPGSIVIDEEIEVSGYLMPAGKYYSSGVEPASIQVGIDLLKQAIKKSDYRTDEMKNILNFNG